jgi:hypothetical protein
LPLSLQLIIFFNVKESNTIDPITPTDQVVPAFGLNKSDFEIAYLLYTPSVVENTSLGALEPLKMLIERVDTLTFCKSYLYDRSFLPIESIHEWIQQLLEITTD